MPVSPQVNWVRHRLSLHLSMKSAFQLWCQGTVTFLQSSAHHRAERFNIYITECSPQPTETHLCCQSHCEHMWPIDHRASSLIVTHYNRGHTDPFTSFQACWFAQFSLCLPPQKTTAATQLLFGLFHHRPGHTTSGRFLFTHPFALLARLPWLTRHPGQSLQKGHVS